MPEVCNRNKKNGGTNETPLHANGKINIATRMTIPMRTVKQNSCGDVFHNMQKSSAYMRYRTTNNTQANRF